MDMDMTTTSDDKQASGLRRAWFASNGSRQDNGKRPDKSSPRADSPRRLAFWLRLLLIMFLINLFFYGPFLFGLLGGQTTTIDLSYSRFLRQVEQSNVTAVTIKSDNSVTGGFKHPVREQQAGARQGSVAATQFLPEDDRRNYLRSYLLARLAVALGGRAGEEGALGEITSEAENDLKEATRLARRMGEKTGLAAYDLDGENAYPGQPAPETPGRVYSGATAERVDAEVERLLEQAHQQACSVLSEHRAALERLAQELLREEVVERNQVLAIIAGATTAQSSAGGVER